MIQHFQNIFRMVSNKFLLVLLLLFGLVTQSFGQYQVTKAEHTASSVLLTLNYIGSQDYYLKQTSPISKTIQFILKVLSYSDFNFKVIDLNRQRFQVPQESPFPVDPLTNFSFPLNLSSIRFDYTESPFQFRISRKLNNATIFSTYGTNLIYSAYYIQISTSISTQYIYGLGQRFNRGYKIRNGKWTIFNRDRGHVIDDGEGLQTYGHFPVYLQRQNENYFHINYFRNSNGMDIIKNSEGSNHSLVYKTIGGIIDFRFFLGEQVPELVLRKFHLYLGRSAIPPFWSLGVHQSRWGYHYIQDLEKVIQSYQQNNLPLDTIWSDIDYMDEYEDFTIDEKRFPLEKLNQIIKDYHYVPIIDAGIDIRGGIAYEQGHKKDVFIKDPYQKQYIGEVWPGKTTFVDYLHPNATTYWGDMLAILNKKVNFSGIWLDMNEFSNFCDGACETPSTQPIFDYSKDLPYNPGSQNIERQTISLNSTHYGNRTQADVHAFNGFLETYATNVYLQNQNMRPFIVSRSTTLGSNRYGFHWSSDNQAKFEFLKGSIADNFYNQMWGFQMTGAIVCGFRSNATEELCSRWYQLSTMYSFHINHNDNESISQEPYALGKTVLQSAQTNLKLRYSLLKHMYSMIINRKGVGTIFTPLFFHYPFDDNLYVDEIADTQFLVGDLLVTPIVEEGKTSRNIYLPVNNWYDLHNGDFYKNGTSKISDIELSDKLPIFLREGTLILMQNTDKVMKTYDLGYNFTLVSGFRYEPRRSNSTMKIYEAVGSHISIQDYEDQDKLDQCLSQNCDYIFDLLLWVGETDRELQMRIEYSGGAKLNEFIIINELKIYYEGIKVHKVLDDPIEIRGTCTITVPLPGPQKAVNLKTEQA